MAEKDKVYPHVCQDVFLTLFTSGRFSRKDLEIGAITPESFKELIRYFRIMVQADLKRHPPKVSIAVVDRLTRPQTP